ncbi:MULTISPECIES: GntR family transcriptional regulator [Tatumella]|uniref:FadR/GntR family transcriptional regulator n=1 Tax=Tatumella punctata TaxID=399969 RepID=A0ABW1VPV6_9GAMM|nr:MULTISPECIES: GntR family transcriptional regulator [unclassified Tatumella]MBS0856302.1 GntR family transcriptional regulator [Tatumella sp. JGM16]MBS0876349.1 GntR family transcriptional regulator [Tatumella sp. JGM82]MBS0889522.1 GntR family transcriptional regulator [Tatumella sp. JGM94]MBS0894330.1 GntR family transcriptional regulator [Tatumella sp. JGM130]MBS0900644.1 GntR family transcriptional regulator [Tatumella sp. JGM100]
MITHAVIFSPIGQSSRSDQIIQRLANAIISGLLAANEQLPNEADLARMMGVSHITIREALNTLRAKGLIYTARGRNGGSFVAESIAKDRSAFDALQNISTEYLSDLGEWHCAIFVHATRLATSRMTDRDVHGLSQFIDTLEQSATPELRCQSDMRCLLTIAANSQSARIANQELMIQAEWAALVTPLYQSDDFHRTVVLSYRQLLAAFRNNEALQAMEVAGQLINQFISRLIELKFSIHTT